MKEQKYLCCSVTELHFISPCNRSLSLFLYDLWIKSDLQENHYQWKEYLLATVQKVFQVPYQAKNNVIIIIKMFNTSAWSHIEFWLSLNEANLLSVYALALESWSIWKVSIPLDQHAKSIHRLITSIVRAAVKAERKTSLDVEFNHLISTQEPL